MTKDIFVSIKGMQFREDGDDTEEIESVWPGLYFEKSGKQYVRYDEKIEGFEETAKNTIKFSEHLLELVRSGPVNVRMVFEENKKTMTSYHTPYGAILLGIDTKKIHILQTTDRIVVNVDYALDMDGRFLADCELVMELCSQEKV